jgi:hypothetical protein
MKAALLVGLIFSPLAALAAYVITYEEYRRHFPTPGPARRIALQTALIALAVFFVIPILAALVVARGSR